MGELKGRLTLRSVPAPYVTAFLSGRSITRNVDVDGAAVLDCSSGEGVSRMFPEDFRRKPFKFSPFGMERDLAGRGLVEEWS
jgi:hypothetical protein